MSFWLWGVFAAFSCGFAVSVLNFLLSRYALKKHPQMFASFTAVRMLTSIACFALAYFLAPYTPWKPIFLLIGVALGLTIPLFFFTAVLIREASKPSPTIKKKEDEDHG